MRLAAAAMTLLLLTGAAYAQPALNLWADDKYVDPERAQKQREIDQAYKEKLKSQAVPAQAPVNDPWGNVRSSGQPATSQTKQQTNSKTR